MRASRRSLQVNVRLSEEEIGALRTLPGENDSERLRYLIHRHGLVETVNEHTTRDGEQTRDLVTELGRWLHQMMRHYLDKDERDTDR